MGLAIGIACDHAGYELKEKLLKYFDDEKIKTKDFGTYTPESSDYADYAHPLAEWVEKEGKTFGISICGSGNGISMTVNKHQGIRAALCWNPEVARLARFHNNANICSIPARFVTFDIAKLIIQNFLNTSFEGGRHIERINKIPLK
jgi:ribose 5-phosphate isomerase B